MFVFCLPVSVPLSIFVIRYGVKVGQRDDVAAVWAQPLLVEAAFPVLQLALVLVGDADVGVVVLHAHPSHGGVVTLQELVVHPLIMLHETEKNIRFAMCLLHRSHDDARKCTSESGELRHECDHWLCYQLDGEIQTENHTSPEVL